LHGPLCPFWTDEMSDVELTNCQITLSGLFGEISEARRMKIQEQVSAKFPTTVATPATGILAFTNPMSQEVLVIGPNAFNFTFARANKLKIEELRKLYERLFDEGLLAETVTPTLELGSIVSAPMPLQRLKARAGQIFDAGFEEKELIGMGVRKIYRHDNSVVDVRLENNFQGEDRYHCAVRVESEMGFEWRHAFDRLCNALDMAEKILNQLSSVLADTKATA